MLLTAVWYLFTNPKELVWFNTYVVSEDRLEVSTLVWKITEWWLSDDFSTFDLLVLPVLIQILSCFFEAGAEFHYNSAHMYHTFQKWLDVTKFTKYRLLKANTQKFCGQGSWVDISILQVGGVIKHVWLFHYSVGLVIT